MEFPSWPLLALATLLPWGIIISETPAAESLESARQAVVVLTETWQASEAHLQCYERAGATGPWQPIGKTVRVMVGKNGLGWGSGLVKPTMASDDPKKQEGDGRAPAGVFGLSAAFGYAPKHEASWIRLPYREATEALKCVDDARSAWYNRLVDQNLVKERDWSSAEDMRRQDDQYRLGVVVEHNTAPITAGKGSCIFLHLWEHSQKATSGCTAMSLSDMEDLLRWLNPAFQPILAQMTAESYQQHRPLWGLP